MPPLQLVVERGKDGGGGRERDGRRGREGREGRRGEGEGKGEGGWRERRDQCDPAVLRCGGSRGTLAFTVQWLPCKSASESEL